MKIRKSTFKNGQAWLSIESDDGEYIGTWHIVEPHVVEHFRTIDLDKYELKMEECNSAPESSTKKQIAHELNKGYDTISKKVEPKEVKD